jgi:hypothetical protein
VEKDQHNLHQISPSVKEEKKLQRYSSESESDVARNHSGLPKRGGVWHFHTLPKVKDGFSNLHDLHPMIQPARLDRHHKIRRGHSPC